MSQQKKVNSSDIINHLLVFRGTQEERDALLKGNPQLSLATVGAMVDSFVRLDPSEKKILTGAIAQPVIDQERRRENTLRRYERIGPVPQQRVTAKQLQVAVGLGRSKAKSTNSSMAGPNQLSLLRQKAKASGKAQQYAQVALTEFRKSVKGADVEPMARYVNDLKAYNVNAKSRREAQAAKLAGQDVPVPEPVLLPVMTDYAITRETTDEHRRLVKALERAKEQSKADSSALSSFLSGNGTLTNPDDFALGSCSNSNRKQ